MITFNHEQYIAGAIDGVLKQQIDFDTELIISNDCSTDATDQIIRQIIKHQNGNNKIIYIDHKKNIGVELNAQYALKQCNGKYIAMCEGDDYWTDPNKSLSDHAC